MKNGENRSNREIAAAFVARTLTPEEMAAVEKRLAADDELRHEVEAARRVVAAAQDWLDAEAPGIERADVLAAPHLKATSDIAVAYCSPIEARRAAPPRRRFAPAFQFAAAAAIFLIGFWLGTRTSGEAGDASRQSPIAISNQNSDGTPPAPEVTPALAEPSPTPSTRPAPPQPGHALAQGPQYKTDDQGRLIIETMLAGKESATPAAPRPRAIVVVDGGFRLNQ